MKVAELLNGLLAGKCYKCKKMFMCAETEKCNWMASVCYGNLLEYVRDWEGRKHYVWMDEFNDICVKKRVI